MRWLFPGSLPNVFRPNTNREFVLNGRYLLRIGKTTYRSANPVLLLAILLAGMVASLEQYGAERRALARNPSPMQENGASPLRLKQSAKRNVRH